MSFTGPFQRRRQWRWIEQTVDETPLVFDR
jgi:hypothetical protein